MPLTPGQILNNRYRIVRLLGQGGFGAGYRAWDILWTLAPLSEVQLAQPVATFVSCEGAPGTLNRCSFE